MPQIWLLGTMPMTVNCEQPEKINICYRFNPKTYTEKMRLQWIPTGPLEKVGWQEFRDRMTKKHHWPFSALHPIPYLDLGNPKRRPPPTPRTSNPSNSKTIGANPKVKVSAVLRSTVHHESKVVFTKNNQREIRSVQTPRANNLGANVSTAHRNRKGLGQKQVQAQAGKWNNGHWMWRSHMTRKNSSTIINLSRKRSYTTCPINIQVKFSMLKKNFFLNNFLYQRLNQE